MHRPTSEPRIRRRCLALLAIAVITLGFFTARSAEGLTPTVSSTGHSPISGMHDDAVKAAVLASRAEMVRAQQKLSAQLDAVTADISTGTIDELIAASGDQLARFDAELPGERFDALFGYRATDRASMVRATIAVRSEARERISNASAAVRAVAAEASAERQRRAEAAAAEAAARARVTSFGGGGGGSEDDQQRVQRIAASTGLPIPTIVISTCSIAGALGCYTWSRDYIVITPLGLSRSDCTLREVLAHEYRHFWQYQQSGASAGQLDIAALEADAYAFGDAYGC